MRIIHRMEFLYGHPASFFQPVVDQGLKEFKTYAVKVKEG